MIHRPASIKEASCDKRSKQTGLTEVEKRYIIRLSAENELLRKTLEHTGAKSETRKARSLKTNNR